MDQEWTEHESRIDPNGPRIDMQSWYSSIVFHEHEIVIALRAIEDRDWLHPAGSHGLPYCSTREEDKTAV